MNDENESGDGVCGSEKNTHVWQRFERPRRERAILFQHGKEGSSIAAIFWHSSYLSLVQWMLVETLLSIYHPRHRQHGAPCSRPPALLSWRAEVLSQDYSSVFCVGVYHVVESNAIFVVTSFFFYLHFVHFHFIRQIRTDYARCYW